MNDEIYEPLKQYNSTFKEQFNDKVSTYFDEALKRYNIDVSLNDEQYRNLLNLRNDLTKFKKKEKLHKGFYIFFLVLAIITSLSFVGSFLLYFYTRQIVLKTFLISLFSSALIATLSYLLAFLNFRPKAKRYLEQANNLADVAEQKQNEIRETLADLYSDLNANSPNLFYRYIGDVTKIIQFDEDISLEKVLSAINLCEMPSVLEDTQSCLYLKTGSIVGYPLFLFTTKDFKIVKETFTGSRTVTYRSGDSLITTTLTASLEVDVPKFTTSNFLIFASDVAPNLTFSRLPSGIRYPANEKEKKKYQKQIDQQYNNIVKRHEKLISEGVNFTPLGDPEFEVMYNALNRDNDVEFRLLFTPLARQNYLSDLKSQDPVADDFYFNKSKKLNSIFTNHAQRISLSGNPDGFYNLSVENLKANFVNYANDLFKHIYYNLIPILNIPIYQQHKAREFIYDDRDYKNIFAPYEYELIANSIDPSYFLHQNSKTEGICKIASVSPSDLNETVDVVTTSFDCQMRVTEVPVTEDGRSFLVPVQWPEYTKLENKNSFIVDKSRSVTREDQNSLFYRSHKIILNK